MLAPADCMAVVSRMDDSELTGRIMGCGIFAALVLMGVIRSLRTMRKPASSRLCVLSLVLVLVGWLITSVYGIYLSSFPGAAMNLWVYVPLVGFSVILLISGIVLSIVGLCQYGPPGRHVQGRGHALWAIVLSCLVLGLFGWGMIKSVKARNEMGLEPLQTDAASETPAAVRFEEQNFAITPPTAQWQRQTKPSIVGSNAGVWMNMRTQTGLGIESGPMLAISEVSDLISGMREHFQSDPQFSNLSEIREVRDGVRSWSAWEVDAALKSSTIKLSYSYRVTVIGGRFYSVFAWGTPKNIGGTRLSVDQWTKGFSIIDPAKKFTTEFEDVDSDLSGFRTRLTPLGWKPYDYDPGAFPTACWKASKNRKCALAGYLWRFEPGIVPDQEAAIKAMLGVVSVAMATQENAVRQDIEWDGMKVRQMVFDEKVADGTVEKHIRITSDGTTARMVLGFFEKSTAAADTVNRAAVLEGIDASHFSPMVMSGGIPENWSKRWALCNNDAGLSYFTRQNWSEAHRFFSISLKMHPDVAVAGNLVNTLMKLGDYQEAARASVEWLAHFPGNGDLLAWQGGALEKVGKDAEAIACYQKAVAGGYEDDEMKVSLLRLLLETGKKDEAVAAAESFFKASSTPKRARWLASVHERAGHVEVAISQLEERLSKPPFEAESAYQLAETFNGQGRFADTERIVGRLRDAGQDTARTAMIEGWSYMGRKWYPRAKESFVNALAKAPDDPEVKIAVDEAAGGMGQGGREGADREIPPVEIPAEMSAKVAPAEKVPDAAKGEDACYLQSVEAIHWEPGLRLVRTVSQRIRILDRSALEALNTLEFKFVGRSERIWMNQVEITSPDGTRRQQVSPAETWVKDEQSVGMATSDRTFYIPVPGLEVGSTIDVRVTWQDIGTESEMPWQHNYLANAYNSAKECVIFTGAVEKMKAKVSGSGVVEMKLPQAVLWTAGDPVQVHREPFLPFTEEFAPSVSISATGRDWKTLGDTYLKELEPLFTPDDAVASLALRTVAGAAEPADKVRAVASRIQKDLTYRGIEFGTRARIPSTCGKILSDRSGDCKDHALLLVQMLRACGIPANLVLAKTGGDVVAELPDLDQFDHMIVHVPGHTPSPWIDLTDKYSPPGDYTPMSLAGHSVLVLEAGGSRLMTVPQLPEISGTGRSVRKVRIAADGVATVEESLTLTGSLAAWMRATFGSGSPRDFPKIIQQYMTGVTAVTTCEVPDMNDPRVPLNLRLVYTMSSVLKPSADGSRNSQAPSCWESVCLFIKTLPDRHHPWQLYQGIGWESDVTVFPPAGAANLKELPKGEKGSDKHTRWSLVWEKADAAAVRMRFKFSGLAGKGYAGSYKDFCASWRAGLQALEQPVCWKPD
ncbi:MAG: tetratricopeptide repeat protein [Luteolibacter sp.]